MSNTTSEMDTTFIYYANLNRMLTDAEETELQTIVNRITGEPVTVISYAGPEENPRVWLQAPGWWNAGGYDDTKYVIGESVASFLDARDLKRAI